jgi:hypothetical protein
MQSHASNSLAAVATLFVVAAIFATTVLWPDTAEFDDPDPAAKTFAVLAGATLLVPAVVCWVGSVVVARLDTLVTRGKG